ncbi:MAG: putative DNA modification/repair radical SAM protein [Myxococcota bacterium]
MPKIDPIINRLKILAQGARFDASCASPYGGGLTFNERRRDISRFIYHSWTEDGRCVPILKVLLTNYCIYDCAYCHNRRSNDIERSTFTPEELANITSELHKRHRIEGLFLSSGIIKDADYTMELMLRTISILRDEHKFSGYIHTKILPGTDEILIEKIGRLADRISVNIELPSEDSLKFLAPDKDREKILRPMITISELIKKYRYDNKKFDSTLRFSPSGHSTQIIVGATEDTDYRMLLLSEYLYKRLSLSRVYYSAYVPVNEDSRLPRYNEPPLRREHRLYQADWLIRDYGFEIGELLSEGEPNLSLMLDPKTEWALKNLNRFPIDINKADYEELIRIPGIGIRTARRILNLRRYHSLNETDLKRLKVPMKRSSHFILINGRYIGQKFDSDFIKSHLIKKKDYEQLRFIFDRDEIKEDLIASNTGEL